MYSETIKLYVDEEFAKISVHKIIEESASSREAIDRIVQRVSNQTASLSLTIFQEMLNDLNHQLLETPFFAADASREIKFWEMKLDQEILDKYQFAECKFEPGTIDYNEPSRALQAAKTGGLVFDVGGAAEIGYVLIRRLELSDLVPLPIGILVGAALSAALADYFLRQPAKNKKTVEQVVDQYLQETKEQLLLWFDEVERYYHQRVEEFKKTL